MSKYSRWVSLQYKTFMIPLSDTGLLPRGSFAKCTPSHTHADLDNCFDVWQVSVETELGFVRPSGPLVRLWHHLLDIHTSVGSKEAETGEHLTLKDSCVPTPTHTHTCTHTHLAFMLHCNAQIATCTYCKHTVNFVLRSCVLLTLH